jgi:integrase
MPNSQPGVNSHLLPAVERVWSDDAQLPKLEVDDWGWTLHVLGKGRKARSVSLPATCVAVLTEYRQLRGLPARPNPYEHAPLIHGIKGGSLRSSGLYDEVKAIVGAVVDRLGKTDHAGAARLRSASPHWLRHAYARALVVDHQVPLPAAQALLGHASVQTTAGYYRPKVFMCSLEHGSLMAKDSGRRNST